MLQFRHETEDPQAGYYSVYLDRWQVQAEVTASQLVGYHRYSFTAGQPMHVLIDLAHAVLVTGSQQPDTFMNIDVANQQMW